MYRQRETHTQEGRYGHMESSRYRHNVRQI